MRQFIRAVRQRYYIIALVHCLIIGACAQISTPTGGPRDTTPPVVQQSNPPNYSIRFSQKTIKIEFDKWIQPLQNAKNQVIISPSIEPFPKIEAARNELTIKIKDSLQSNTTYSLFFGDNIKDNNEGNMYPNYKYIFSTGDFIDSLKVKGTLKTAMDKMPDNVYLLLYKEKEDSAFTTKRPFYITKTGADGSFNLENIKEGDYRIYALSDKNGNYYYDLPTEAIGFTDSILHIRSAIDSLSFSIFLPEEEKLRVVEFDRLVKGGMMRLSFNKELSFNQDEIRAVLREKPEIAPIFFQDKTAKKASIYFPKLETDTASYTLILTNKEQLIDSFSIRTDSKRFSKPVPFFNDTTRYKSLSVIETRPLFLLSDYYSLSPIDTSRIFITDTANNSIPYSIGRDEDLQTYIFRADWKSGMKYKIQLSDSVLTDLAGNYSKKQDLSLSVVSAKKAGNLLITYILPSKTTSYIAFLKDNSGKVLDKQILRDSQSVKIDYGLQLPGMYNVELIEDTNNNGIWNSGSFIRKTLPEKIYKEPKPVILKENWDAEEIVKVDFTLQPSPANPVNNEPVKGTKPGGNSNKQNILNNNFDKED